MREATGDRTFWREISILLGLIVLIYARTLGGDYLSWDDIQHFQFNTWLQAGNLAHFWTHEYYGLYIPLTYNLWTIIYKVTGGTPVALHALNIVLHVANSLFVYLLARRLSPRSAHAAALIFACHPLQVEAVAWISAGRDLLSAFFGLGALLLLEKEAPRRATVLFVLGLLCKPALAPLPLAWLFVRRTKLSPPYSVLWSALGAAALIATYLIQEPFAVLRAEPLPLWLRPLLAADALGYYIRLFLWPWPQSADYARLPHEIVSTQAFWPYVLLFVGAATLVWRRLRHPGFAFALVMLLPVLGLAPFAAQAQSTVFDRYMYLPMVGVALALAPLFARYWRPATALLLIWIGLSFHRTGVWLSNRALCTDILENNPRNYFAQVNLANDDLARGLLASAETHLQEARRLNPRLALAPANLANVYWQKRDPASILLEFEPLLHDREFLQYNLHEPQALALLYRMVARAHSILRHTSEARDDYQQALLINPYDEELKREVELFNAEQMH